MWPQAKECKQFLEAQKVKQYILPESPQKDLTPTNIMVYTSDLQTCEMNLY